MDQLWSKKLKLALVATGIGLVLRNIHLERQTRDAPQKMNSFFTWFHSIIFIARIIPTLTIKRLLRIKSVTSNWWLFEEIAMRVIHFHGMVGDVNVPNVAIAGLVRANISSGQTFMGLNVTQIPKSDIGFGPNSTGRPKFGKSAECSALWVTMGENVSYETPGIVKILYIHGGGFVIGQAGMYMLAHAKLLKDLRDRGFVAGIIDVDYPLAPGAKHPVPTETCIHVYEHLVHHRQVIRPEDLIVGGDSAGGIIALNVALRATQWGCAGVLLISPWVGHSCDTPSHEEFADVDFIGGKLLIEQFQEAHVQGGRAKSITDNSLDVFKKELPFCALPPVWLSVGGFEVFQDDILRFAKDLESNDVQVQLYFGQEVPHIFPMLWPLFVEKSGPALENAAEFCVACLTKAQDRAKLINQSLNQDEVTKFRKVLSQPDFSKEFVKSLVNSDGTTLKSVLSSTNFADLINS